MKKVCLVLAGLVVILSVCLFADSRSLKAYQSEILAEKLKSETFYPDIYNYLPSLPVKAFEEKVSQKETFVVYVGRPTCPDCNAFEPELIKWLQEKNIKNVIYLNVAELRRDEQKWADFKAHYDIQYTPTLAKFEAGQNVAKVSWTPETGTDLEAFDKWLDQYGQ